MSDVIKNWVFTWGSGHPFAGCYIEIHGTHGSAREEMVKYFGIKWCGQYESRDKAGVERYGLKQLPGIAGS
jgi:hypothetical protein